MQHPHYAPEPFDPKASRPGQPVIVDPRVDHPTQAEVDSSQDQSVLVWAVLVALAVLSFALATFFYPVA